MAGERPQDGSPARRLRLVTILAIVAFAGLTLLATTQPWWTVHTSGMSLEVVGTVASPALSVLALTGLALAAALSISGPVFRAVLGVLQVAVGGTVVFAALVSATAPVRASESVVSHATGVAGSRSIADLVDSVALTAWPWVAVASGCLSALVGIALVLTFRRWPSATRKYDAVRLENPAAPRDAVGDWDALSDGSDPTVR